jgi:hypothetical protein
MGMILLPDFAVFIARPALAREKSYEWLVLIAGPNFELRLTDALVFWQE